MSIFLIFVAVLCFAIDVILTFAAPGAQWISVCLYLGLATFAASFFPWGGPYPWNRPSA